MTATIVGPGGSVKVRDTDGHELEVNADGSINVVGAAGGGGDASEATLQLLLAELQQKLEDGQEVALDAATLAALESVTAAVTGTVAVSNFPETQPVSGTVTAVDVPDVFESLPDQAGAGAVLTFTFASAAELVWVRSVGGVSRADPDGGTPTASQGIYCADDEPTPITFSTSEVKVYAPSGATVSVWGFGHA